MKYHILSGWKPMRLNVAKKMKVEVQRKWDTMQKAMEEFGKTTGLPDNWRSRIIKSTK